MAKLKFIQSTSGTHVSTLTLANCFSSSYSTYFLQIPKARFGGNAYIWVRFMDSGGSLINQSEYDSANLDMYANTTYANLGADSGSAMTNFALTASGVEYFGGMSYYIMNPYESDYTYTIGQSSSFSSNGRGTKGIGVHKSEEQLSGVQINRSDGGNFDMEAIIFGVEG